MKIGFLIYQIKNNPKPKDELDIFKILYKVVYSWEEMPSWARKRYDRQVCLFLQALFTNKSLQQEILKFRKKFGLPEGGIPFIGNEKRIRRVGKGYQYKYDLFLDENQYKKAEHSIRHFARNWTIPHPLKVQLRTIFYSGFVTDSISSAWEGLSLKIPTMPKRTTRTIAQYRPGIIIKLNSASITKNQFHDFIDENWHRISRYFKDHPHICDCKLSEEKLFLVSHCGTKEYDVHEVVASLDVHYPIAQRGKEFHQRNPESVRKEIKRALEEVNKLIQPIKKKQDKKR